MKLSYDYLYFFQKNIPLMNVKNNNVWRSIWITVCSKLSLLNKRFVMSGTLQDLCTQRKEMCCIICINDLDISAPQTSWH